MNKKTFVFIATVVILISTFFACNKIEQNPESDISKEMQSMSSQNYFTLMSEIPDKGGLTDSQKIFIETFKESTLFQKYYNSSNINIGSTIINYSKSFIGRAISANNKTVPVYNLALEKNGILVGYAIFYQKPAYFILNNPEKDAYVLGFRDYSGYSIILKSGVVKDIDINTDFHVGSILIDNGVIDWGNSEVMGTPGDANADGNLTWSECYHYMVNVCESDPQCHVLLDAVNLAAGAGTLAIMAACGVLATMY